VATSTQRTLVKPTFSNQLMSAATEGIKYTFFIFA
jgi:hypothetical protein